MLLQYPDGGPLFLEATLRSDAPVGPLPSFKKPAASGDFLGKKHTINFNHFQSLLKLLIVKVTMVAPTLFVVFFLWKYHRNLNMFLVDLQGPYILKASKILI